MDLDATGKQLGEKLAAILDATPREQHPTVLMNAINSAIDGVKAAVLTVVRQEVVSILGEHYDGPGKLRDRVRALEEIAKQARIMAKPFTDESVTDDERYDAVLAARLALQRLDATEATKTG